MFLQNYAKPTTNWVARDMQRQREFVDKYMRSIDAPHWFRGLSSFQYRAASNLLHAIRDDLEQDTSHRVRDILNTIGLQPPLSKRNVRFVMKLSRGNDLAFLWFLKDLYYTTDEPGYNTNEQLILSCIAYLDLIFTIRGLDNLLPAPQQPKHKPPKRKMSRIVIERMSRRKIQYSRLLPRLKQTRSFHKQSQLPYLERQRRPRPYGKSLTARPPVNVLKLKFLDAFKDPNYVIPNESSRWFSSYEPNEGRKTANSLVNEQLTEIFKANLVKIPSQVFEAQLFKKLRLSGTALRKNSKQELGRNILCEHHKVMQEMEKSLELELRVIALEKCRKYFDLDIPKKEKRIARLRKQIENDVNLHLLRFRELADKSRSQLLLWSKDDLQVCDLSNDTSTMERESCDLCTSKKPGCRSVRTQNTQSECHFGLKPTICKSTQKNRLAAKSEYKIRTQNLRNNTEPEIIGDCLHNNNRGNHSTQRRKSPLTANCGCCNVFKPKVHNCDSNYDYMQNYDYGHSDTSSETKTYFNAPQKHSPFKFDYQKIFDIPFEQADDINIKRVCVEAIRSEECLSNHLAESRENIDAAIRNCTMKTMKENFSKRNIDYGTEPLIPSAKAKSYYDPNDKALMHQMLKEGIERLAQDTRYVLAALPDAHKLPILRYWIYQRYGKVYTQKEMSDIFKTSTLLFRALLQIQIYEALPSPTDLGRAVFVDYSCHNYLMRKCDRIRDLYYKRVDKAIMNQSRHLYIAMTPYIYAGRSPNKTIFAYLPSRPNDIQHFRVWSPRDCKLKKGKYDQHPGQ